MAHTPTNLQNAQQIGQLAELGITAWGPATLSPADYWLTFVSNQSSYGNWAIYSNPTVVNAALAFTQSSNVTYIQSLVAQAQKQVYDDAPYAWFGVTGLWTVSGSPVWKTSLIKSMLFDPTWAGQDDQPFFNTIVFAGS